LLWPRVEDDPLQDDLPEQRIDLDHPAVAEELAEIAPHRPVVRRVRGAQIEQQHADLGAFDARMIDGLAGRQHEQWGTVLMSAHLICRRMPRKPRYVALGSFRVMPTGRRNLEFIVDVVCFADSVRRPQPSPPIAKSQISLTLSPMISTATTAASPVSQRGAARSPSLRRLAVNITSGTTANGNWKLRITWLKMRSLPACAAPKK